MHFLKNRIRAWHLLVNMVREKRASKIIIVRDQYPGINDEPVPLKIFHPVSKTDQTIILYPGASPSAEEHPGMNKLGLAFAEAGFLTFAPRIPLLKELRLSDEINIWVVHFYHWLCASPEVNPSRIGMVGLSYGGALVLKANLDPFLIKNPPTSILVYGTFFNVETALKFLLTGNMTIDGKTHHVSPNTWGLIVFFHNFLSKVDIGYDTEDIQRILAIRINDMEEKAIDEANNVEGEPGKLLLAILQSEITPEISRISEHILNEYGHQIQSLSPENWCEEIDSKIFIMHGANDSMSPYTESIKLAEALKNSVLHISYLYEHKEISTDKGILFKLKEFFAIWTFLSQFIKANK